MQIASILFFISAIMFFIAGYQYIKKAKLIPEEEADKRKKMQNNGYAFISLGFTFITLGVAYRTIF